MTSSDNPQAFPCVITRAEIIEGLREQYNLAAAARKREEPSFVSWPDALYILDYIEEKGLPPKSVNFTMDLPDPLAARKGGE